GGPNELRNAPLLPLALLPGPLELLERPRDLAHGALLGLEVDCPLGQSEQRLAGLVTKPRAAPARCGSGPGSGGAIRPRRRRGRGPRSCRPRWSRWRRSRRCRRSRRGSRGPCRTTRRCGACHFSFSGDAGLSVVLAGALAAGFAAALRRVFRSRGAVSTSVRSWFFSARKT